MWVQMRKYVQHMDMGAQSHGDVQRMFNGSGLLSRGARAGARGQGAGTNPDPPISSHPSQKFFPVQSVGQAFRRFMLAEPVPRQKPAP